MTATDIKIPSGFCQCGCNQKTKLAPQSSRRLGWIKGEPIKFINNHHFRIINQTRTNNHNWNGGRIKTKKGYIKVLLSGHPRTDTKGYVYEHIIIAEKSLGKYLPTGAEIHHINEIKDDNRPENLIICQNRSYHWLIHQRQRAIQSSGDSNKRKCSICKEYDLQDNLFQCGTWFFHKSCKNKKARDNYIPKGRR